MKKTLFVLMVFLSLSACRKEIVPSGDLFITARYDGVAEENVEVWVYETWEKFLAYEYLVSGFTNEYGEILFEGLEPAKYYLEAEKEKSSLFVITKVDSVTVEDGRQANKILNLEPPDAK